MDIPGHAIKKGAGMDRRQRKTRKAIFDAFEELMAHGHYSQVTVAQIIEQADIGRSTFYAHFETKDELTEQICAEMFDHIFEGVDAHCVTHAELQTPDLKGKLAHLLYHLRDAHSGVAGKLLMEGEPHFTAYFRSKLIELFESDMPSTSSDIPLDLRESLMVSAYCQTVSWWFEGNCTADPEQLSEWFNEFVSS